jgi:hypothetical protein
MPAGEKNWMGVVSSERRTCHRLAHQQRLAVSVEYEPLSPGRWCAEWELGIRGQVFLVFSYSHFFRRSEKSHEEELEATAYQG